MRGSIHLAGLYPPFADYIRQLLAIADQYGLDPVVTEGYRSIERQAELYAQGRTTRGQIVTNAQPGASAHNYGLAVDITSGAGYGTEKAAQIHQLAQALGFGTISWDEPHVEWPNWKALLGT